MIADEKIKNSSELEFAVFCIENVAAKLGVSAEKVYNALAEKSDILYYVLYAVIARVLNKRDIKPSDIKTLDLNSVTDSIIVDVRDRVYEIYKQHGGNGRVAKSAEFIQYIDAILEE